MRAWLTPGEISEKRFCRCLSGSVSVREAVTGALLLLADPGNWEAHGAVSPEDAASECAAMLKAFLGEEVCCMPVGVVLPFAGQDLPPGFLWCKGVPFDPEEYPELYAVIGTTYGEIEGQPITPDLQGRFPRGEQGGNLGEAGGEATVTLTVEQLPRHAHTAHYHAGYAPGGEIPGLAAGIPIQFEGNYTGGGEAHNNLPPYQTFNYIIKAKP